jgi:UDP-N-acetyl-D-glucosamine dehydrogenase
MPGFIAEKVRQALNQARKALNGSNILVLGVAYKKDVSDVRESPALDVIRLLQSDGANVSYHDPLVPTVVQDGNGMTSVALDDDALTRADAVVLLTDHSAFDYPWILAGSTILVDARNATAAIDPASRPRPTWIVKGVGTA